MGDQRTRLAFIASAVNHTTVPCVLSFQAFLRSGWARLACLVRSNLALPEPGHHRP